MIESSKKIKSKKKRRARQRAWAALGIILAASALLSFKYFSYITLGVANLLQMVGVSMQSPQFSLALPLGMSFYVLRAIGYLLDLYKTEDAAQKNVFKLALYLSFFPYFAGPIEPPGDFFEKLAKVKRFGFSRLQEGVLAIGWGLFKKMVVADRIAVVVNTVFERYNDYAGFIIVVAAILLAFQIYSDLSGLLDIARGVGEILGFDSPVNFIQPLFSTSMINFWGRWNSSLSGWFVDHVYEPLGGGSRPGFFESVNVIAMFLAYGLWHGISLKYALWGLMHGIVVVSARNSQTSKEALTHSLRIRTTLFSYRLAKIIVTFLLVDVTWIFFRASDIFSGYEILQRMVSEFNPWVFIDGSFLELGLGRNEFSLMITGILLLIVIDICSISNDIRQKIQEQNAAFRWLVYLFGIFFIIVFGVYGPRCNPSPFIYLQF
jgi:D-alanyl-lipoteichoic acid acyltransferase DltB (MBOAT superfamily)